jgi:hypothetical protein
MPQFAALLIKRFCEAGADKSVELLLLSKQFCCD